MKCSVFIATSVDGYIATPDGGVDWLQSAGNLDVDMGSEDMGFQLFMDSVDCMIMGRKCMEMISSMNLSPEQWPYGSTRIIVLSHTLSQPPENLCGKVEMYAGDIQALVSVLANEGFKRAYVDGGSTITSFLNLGLIDDMTITQAPVLLGEGISLFGKLDRHLTLDSAEARSFPNDFTQIQYCVRY